MRFRCNLVTTHRVPFVVLGDSIDLRIMMGELTLSLSMCIGITVSSWELRDSTGYCTASLSFMALSTDLYSVSSQGNSFMSQMFKFLTFVFNGERIARSANHSGLVPLTAKLGYTAYLNSSRLATHFPRSVG